MRRWQLKILFVLSAGIAMPQLLADTIREPNHSCERTCETDSGDWRISIVGQSLSAVKSLTYTTCAWDNGYLAFDEHCFEQGQEIAEDKHEACLNGNTNDKCVVYLTCGYRWDVEGARLTSFSRSGPTYEEANQNARAYAAERFENALNYECITSFRTAY